MRGRTQPGQGHLALLMQDAQERAGGGCDIAMLGGQRQRYERFGYVPRARTGSLRSHRATCGISGRAAWRWRLWRNTPAGWRAPGHCMKSSP